MIFRTLMWAQFTDLRRNPMQLMMPIMPIFMAFFWSMPSGDDAQEVIRMLGPMAFMMVAYMVGWQLPAVSLGEEKEKRTLEALLLTPARPMQIILSRALTTAVLAFISATGVWLVMRPGLVHPLAFIGAFVLALVFTISMGLFIGLMLPDLRTVSMVGMITMLALVFSAFPLVAEQYPTYWKVMSYLPTRPMQELLGHGVFGNGENVMQHSLVLAAYALVGFGLCALRMRKAVSLR